MLNDMRRYSQRKDKRKRLDNMQSTTANRKHQLDETYFNDITTEEQAYWLGFLWADGSINKTAKRSAGANRLTLAQKPTEKTHLEKFRKALKTDYEIKTRKSTGVCILDINSRPICEALIKLGYGKKENRTNIPIIRTDLIHHFIRGYFDGDGCLSIYDQQVKQWTIHRQEWSITGNPTFIGNVRHLLEHDVETTITVKDKPYKRTKKAITLRYGKQADIEKLYTYMYENATIFLESKHEKFMEYFSYHNP